MAVDEWLLRRAAEVEQVVIRFYEWCEPTLSLGYFQPHGDREQHRTSLDCAVVRRASGGGALVHHHELTYSLVVPTSHPLARQTQAMYDAAHASLIETLEGIVRPNRVKFARVRETESLGKREPFLCFLRRAQGDVVAAQTSPTGTPSQPTWTKICGSAQRRHRGAVLQHGGVLLAGSPQAPELPGIRELSGLAITPVELREQWLGRLITRLDLHEPAAWSLPPEAEIAGVVEAKFGHPDWTLRK